MQSGRRRPRTGETRRTRLPLRIDRLPQDVRDAVLFLKNDQGRTWQEIEEISALPPGEGWRDGRAGFVKWEKLDPEVVELFPNRRLPHSNLHRWYDLRVQQVQQELEVRAVQARTIARAFASSVVEGSDAAVLNAARDQIMSVLSEDATARGRMRAAKALIVLAQVMQEARLNEIKERKVATDERRIKLLEEREAALKRKLEAETEKVAKKLDRGQLKREDLAALVQRTFGIAPAGASGAASGAAPHA